jgi:glycosyltransferase involved in cell wall biosynthesis
VTKLSFLDQDNHLLSEIPAKIRVYRVPFFSPRQLYRKIKKLLRLRSGNDLASRPPLVMTSNSNSRYSLIKSTITKLVNTLILPDIQVLWLPLALIKSLYLIKRHSIPIIFTTSPPNSTHLIGLILKKIARVHWVADFRDPWFSVWSELRDAILLPNYRKKVEELMERMVVDSADRIVSVSEGDRLDLRKKFPHINRSKFHVITNGYDPEDFSSLGTQPFLNSKFVVSHLGYLYGETADEFFAAVESVLEESEELKRNMEIRFVGRIDERYTEIISNSSFSENFCSVGQLKHKDALQNIIYSDVLLVLLGGTRFGEGEIPGKIFEYIASNKVILAITQKDGDTAKILIESGLGVIVEPGDSNSIMQILKKLYREKCERRLTREVNSDFLKQFERRTLTRKLSYILDEVLSENCKLSKN